MLCASKHSDGQNAVQVVRKDVTAGKVSFGQALMMNAANHSDSSQPAMVCAIIYNTVILCFESC